MKHLNNLKIDFYKEVSGITSWLDACNLASDDNTHPLLAKAIYSAMDNVETMQTEQGISAMEAFKYFHGSVTACIDDAESVYGVEFVKKCLAGEL